MRMRNPRRLVPFLLGLAVFITLFYLPGMPAAIDPSGQTIELTHEGKAALGLFLMAGIWWIFEVVPVGITAITIGVFQSLWLIRDTRQAMTDFMDPSVWFIFGSLLIGSAFAKTGLTKRLAYKMLTQIPERTRIIYLGVFAMTASLTLVMAHTAVAAAIFPLLYTIHQLYEPTGKPTRFGKGLFIGMAYTSGAGSIITLLGAARGAVAIGFFRELTGREITFFEVTWFLAPLGILMVIVLWAFICVWFKPERDHLPGLHARAEAGYAKLGRFKKREMATLAVAAGIVVILTARSFLPVLEPLDKSAVILGAALLLFITRILELPDLESMPWNIVLLFGGAMSIGFCLWQTGAAEWLAIGWLTSLDQAHWFLFLMGVTLFVMLMTNFILNVAAIAITLPVALVMAPYMGIDAEVVMFASLAAAGMPFLLLVGAAPNAIAYESHQFQTKEFFVAGLPASALLMIVIALFIWKIWPWMGMPILLP